MNSLEKYVLVLIKSIERDIESGSGELDEVLAARIERLLWPDHERRRRQADGAAEYDSWALAA